jgi:hypothetical protein
VEAYFNALPNNVYKMKASLVAAGHTDILGQPDCGTPRIPFCIRGVYGYLGYPTVWMVLQLQGDKSAEFYDEMLDQDWEWLAVDRNVPRK